MIITLTGPNDYTAQEKLRDLTAGFVSEHGDFGIETIEAGSVEFGRLLETVASLPFLAARRMVIVRDLHTNKTLCAEIEQLLDSVADTTDLIIVEPKFDKRLSLYKTLKKRTEFLEFNELDERQLAVWAVQYVTGDKGTLKQNDAHLLIERVGISQIGLKHELDKLLAFDKDITKRSVELLTEPLPRSSVFDLLDAAFAGDKQKAVRLYEDQRRQQVEPQAIMGMIAWQVHILAVVKLNEDEGAEQIAKDAKLNPFVVRKALSLTRKISKNDAKQLVQRALALDIRLKSEPIDADDAVQHFLLTI